MRVYLDACVLSRLDDDKSQARILAEVEAIAAILDSVAKGRTDWISSPVLEFEVRNNPDGRKRQNGLALLRHAGERIMPMPVSLARAEQFQSFGYGAIGAWHLALAEDAKADVLLTTDDRFLRLAERRVGMPSVDVANPLDWWQRRWP